MICPICKEQNLKSTVQHNEIMVTSLYYSSFYDEEGKYHHHDNNSKSTTAKCSNGHHFWYHFENKCWCGWKGKPEKYKLL